MQSDCGPSPTTRKRCSSSDLPAAPRRGGRRADLPDHVRGAVASVPRRAPGCRATAGRARRRGSAARPPICLPPRVEVADELTSQIMFEERWRAFLDELLDAERLRAEPDDEEALLVLRSACRPASRWPTS